MTKHLPNFLTIFRMLLVPVFVVLLVNPTPRSMLWATVVFCVASITDWLDGYIARAYKAETVFGKLIDPLADKVLVMAALVMLSGLSQEPHVPAWLVVLLLSREMIVTGLRSLAAYSGIVVPASRMAKYKTFWTMVAIVFLLIRESYVIFGFQVHFYKVGIFLLWIALAFSISTGVGYAMALRHLVFNEETK